ncbi:DUF742 domain-containing protein [Nocardia sp. NBC_00565]|uniref:DUF742 domain-containing protein n=1 Tax=Nocardia sp. NBC_00565 TaxID=2975993 RepID=UPI002E81D875|nr:DUF742 domain-containing protein [Nocardia sp. NBC_00565]WUC05739.1 DUF742 domain-containing protein [Nocardia sp. NBC_00565]
MTDSGELWFEDDAGPLVRPFAVARGRTRDTRYELDMITLVVALQPDAGLLRTEPEYAQITRLCEFPQSVAEVAAQIYLPIALTKVLISDLIDDGHLSFRSPSQAQRSDFDDINLLRTVLHGIRNL